MFLVVTARHCLFGHRNKSSELEGTGEISAGTTKKGSHNAVIRSFDLKDDTVKHQNPNADIAVINLSRSFKFGRKIKRIDLPWESNHVPSYGDPVSAVGWGKACGSPEEKMIFRCTPGFHDQDFVPSILQV